MLCAIALFVIIMAVILLVVERIPRAPRWVLVLAFLGPAMLAIGFGLVYPALLTIRSSFYDRTGQELVGFDNYVRAFSDSSFQQILLNTLMWTLVVPVVSTLVGLTYAVLVDRTRFEKFAKTLMFMPMAISMVGASIIWKFMYEYRDVLVGVPLDKQPPQIGLLNQVLLWLGLEPQQFLLHGPWNNLFLMIVMIWIQSGFAMTILSAAIKAIPDSTVEAARLDGVNGLQLFWHITIPSVRPATVVVLTTIAMGTLKVFDIVRTMTGGNFGTGVIANEFYTQSFRQNNQGLGAALAVILFLFVIPLVVYNVRQMRKTEEVR
ncbi:carbohydrate ABC transporter permease [Populibacterium corticicola]|jgi:alpha-glucoside transport system permease protein|uniref:Carbohydrate ABC transporter permease n=1 Tax=Populibacterium corticicola TaxID=1812826 RepID=A0ABW5XG03_9MICO